jgi:hypothetical protein
MKMITGVGAFLTRSLGAQATEATVACNVLNQITGLGRPDSYAVNR